MGRQDEEWNKQCMCVCGHSHTDPYSKAQQHLGALALQTQVIEPIRHRTEI